MEGIVISVPPKAGRKGGGKAKNMTTSKCLMHSKNHIRGILRGKEGGGPRK